MQQTLRKCLFIKAIRAQCDVHAMQYIIIIICCSPKNESEFLKGKNHGLIAFFTKKLKFIHGIPFGIHPNIIFHLEESVSHELQGIGVASFYKIHLCQFANATLRRSHDEP